MLFDIGWPELMLIGVVALVVIGPKDLPRAMRIAGYWVRKARTMSREFQSSIDQMIREAELDEIREDVKKATEFDLEGEFRRTVDPSGELAESIRPELPDYFTESTGEAVVADDEEQPELPFAEMPSENGSPGSGIEASPPAAAEAAETVNAPAATPEASAQKP